MIYIANTLITLGTLMLIVSSIGLITLPDFYSRAHAVSKSETFAVFLLFTGLLFRPELTLGAGVRLAIIILLAARRSHRSGCTARPHSVPSVCARWR